MFALNTGLGSFPPQTTLCLASHCAFIANRDIRNNIVMVNSLIDANTDGVIMMLDWAKAYDSVDHEHVENVVFCMRCDGIGKADEHSKGLHTACDWENTDRGNHWRAFRVSTMTSNAVECVGKRVKKGKRKKR